MKEGIIIDNEQQKAIEHQDGPGILFGGPGTGKTYVLKERIKRLIDNKVSPENILVISNSNIHAEELRKEVIEYFPNEGASLKIFSFNGLGLNILKELFVLTKRKKNFTIIDEQDKFEIISKISGFKEEEVRLLCAHISEVKKKQTEVRQDYVNIIKKYEEQLQKYNCYDYEDLAFYPLRIFNASEDILNNYREKYKWLMVDDYQNINSIQYEFLTLLMGGKNGNLFVTGDVNQSIYNKDGADVRLIRRFVMDYPEAKIYRLKKSYRCSNNILKASSGILNENNQFTGSEEGLKINLSESINENAETEFIVNEILKQVSNGSKLNYSDIGIFCRLDRQFSLIENGLKSKNIPYRRLEQTAFFRQEPIDSIIDYLKYMQNPNSLILKEKLQKRMIITEDESIQDIMKFKQKPVRKILEYIITMNFLNVKFKDAEYVNELLALSDRFEANVEDFLDYVTLGNGEDGYTGEGDKVTLMTLGNGNFEFKCVFISGFEEGLIPYNIIEKDRTDVEGEKRLLYIGMSRAKKFLYLTRAKERFLYGRKFELAASSFLKNIPVDVINYIEEKKLIKDDSQLNLWEN